MKAPERAGLGMSEVAPQTAAYQGIWATPDVFFLQIDQAQSAWIFPNAQGHKNEDRCGRTPDLSGLRDKNMPIIRKYYVFDIFLLSNSNAAMA